MKKRGGFRKFLITILSLVMVSLRYEFRQKTKLL